MDFATLFTGGDGFGIGARAAGLKSVWGVEIDPKIADWAERNDPDLCVFRADVSEVNYASLRTPYLLHASPQCKRASKANQQGESEEDLTQAQGVISALRALRPPVFTLENVWPYREFQSFRNILQALSDLRYKADFWHLNAADYGVPQTRKRLILVGRRDKWPTKPMPTHTDPANISGQPRLFGEELQPWVGWYEAIEDLIPMLPETEFAPWQIERLSHQLGSDLLVHGTNSNGITVNEVSDPSAVIVSTLHSKAALPKALFIAQNGYDGKLTKRGSTSPAFTLTANHNQNNLKALVIDSQNGGGRNITVRDEDSPMFTLTSGDKGRPRAFVVDNQNGTQKDNGKRGLTVRQATEPIFTVMAGGNKPSRAALPGRVVKLTPRALSRLQSVPDWYELPENDRLACTIIGNMVPPLLAQRIVEVVR